MAEAPCARVAPVQPRGHETRARLLETARARLRTHGVGGLSLRDVARASGRSAGALYRYWPDKEAIVSEIVAGVNDELTAVIASVPLAEPFSLAQAADGFADALLAVYAADPALHRALVRVPPALGAWRTPVLPPALFQGARLAIAVLAPGALERDPLAAERLCVALQGITLAWYRQPDPEVALVGLKETLARFTVRSLGEAHPRVTVRSVLALGPQDFAVHDRAPTRSDARASYDAILEAAGELLARDGSDVPLALIAERAGVSVGSLYRFFRARHELLSALAGRIIDAFARRATAALADTAGVDAALDAVITAAADTCLEHLALLHGLAPAVVRGPFLEPPPIPVELAEALRAALARAPCAFDDPALAVFAALHAGHAMFIDAVMRGEDLAHASRCIHQSLRAFLLDSPA